MEAASLGIEGLGGGVSSENVPKGQSVDSIPQRRWPFSEFLIGAKHWTCVAKHKWDDSDTTLSGNGDTGAKARPVLYCDPLWDSFTAIGGTESVWLLHSSCASEAKQVRMIM